MGNIRNRFTELIPKTGQHYIPLVSPFEEFHTSVLKIKKSLQNFIVLYFLIDQDHIHQTEMVGWGKLNIALKKNDAKTLKLVCSSTCFIMEQKKVGGGLLVSHAVSQVPSLSDMASSCTL